MASNTCISLCLLGYLIVEVIVFLFLFLVLPNHFELLLHLPVLLLVLLVVFNECWIRLEQGPVAPHLALGLILPLVRQSDESHMILMANGLVRRLVLEIKWGVGSYNAWRLVMKFTL